MKIRDLGSLDLVERERQYNVASSGLKALKRVEPILLTRRIYVVCNDTMVENPRMVKFIKTTLNKIQIAAKDNKFH